MVRKFISLLLFIGLVFCQNSGASKVELSESELSNIASGGDGNTNITEHGAPISAGGSQYLQPQEEGLSVLRFGDIARESIKESMKKSKMRSWKIERNNFINNYSDIGDIAEGKGGGELWWQKGAIKQGETYNIGGGISYQDLSSIYNNELAAIGAKNSIDKNNKINSPARSLMVDLFKYSAGISLTLMVVAIEYDEIQVFPLMAGSMIFINTKNKFIFDKEKEKYLDGLSKSQIVQFSQIYDPIIEDYKQTYGQDVKKNQLLNKKLNIITGCIAGGILASGIILIAIGNIAIPG